MKALTISQPYASLIASGEKWVENRYWSTAYRGPLAIHAGKGTQHLTRHALRRYPIGAVVATCELLTCVLLAYARECFAENRLPHSWQRDGLGRQQLVAMLTHEHTEGPYAWVLGDMRKLPEPIPCRGAQGLWELTSTIAEKVEAVRTAESVEGGSAE